MTKSYTHEQVTYGAKGRRWEFTAPNYQFATPTMPGGVITAHKVARVINGSHKRCDGMDNLARGKMSTIFHKAATAASRRIR